MSSTLLRGFYRWKFPVDSNDLTRRFFCSKPPDKKSPTFSKDFRLNVKGYVFSKYINAIRNYEKTLENKFPAAMHVYRVFAVGMKDFYADTKKLLKITRLIKTSEQGLRVLTRKELEVYYQMPKEMKKIAPVILISVLPFANYVIFPLAYYFPRQLLTSHFWSIQQRFDFHRRNLEDRLQYNMRVLRFMQAKLSEIKCDENYSKFKRILGLLGSGLHPTPSDILNVKDVFGKKPYELYSLPRSNLKHLCGLHGINRGLAKRFRLAERAYIIHHMDLAIRREGGVHNMPSDSLQYACYLRGLNTTSLSNAAMIEWLEQWVEVSIAVDGNNISMFLYLPILIGYNHPNNWKLLYQK